MLDYIKGSLILASDTEAVIEASHLGYRILIGTRTYQSLPQLLEAVILFVSVVIREDSHRYFGFLSRDERDFFEMLIDLSGIGPKTALSILGHYDPGELIEAATTNDLNKISKVPGVGKKTAERLIVELKGKNLKFTPSKGPIKSTQAQDALAALLQLGFAYPHAQKAVGLVIEEHGETLTLSEIITASLQKVRK